MVLLERRWGTRMLTASDYAKRAAELETLAGRIIDPAAREDLLKTAQGFRDLANRAAVAELHSEAEALHLAERMVGIPSRRAS